MTNNNIVGSFFGYIEGYYGQLLSWSAQHELLAVMAELGMNSYFYAPQDDTAHRFDWRQSYDADWRRGAITACRRLFPVPPVAASLSVVGRLPVLDKRV